MNFDVFLVNKLIKIRFYFFCNLFFILNIIVQHIKKNIKKLIIIYKKIINYKI